MIRIAFFTVCSLALLSGCDWREKSDNTAAAKDAEMPIQNGIHMEESPSDTNLGASRDMAPDNTLADDGSDEK